VIALLAPRDVVDLPSAARTTKGNRARGSRLIPAVHQVTTMSNWKHVNRASLAAISFAVALVCVGVLIMLVRDRWNRPELKSADQARYATTGQAADAAGARVLPTDPKLAVEPAAPGPKQAQPANPN
jgi:hypothetical protein